MDYLRFAVVRFGRIYPLHIAVLSLFVAFETLHLLLPALRGDGVPPFTGGNSLSELVSNLLLLNGMGVESRLTWNGPSWSISAEFWTYLVFGGAVVLLGRRYWLAFIPAVVAGPVILYLFSPKLMDATWDFGFLRCVHGFAVGSLLYHVASPGLLRGRSAPSANNGRSLVVSWTMVEAAAIVAVVLFVANAGRDAVSVAAPFIFALTLFVFAHERGGLSRLLKSRLFLWLGTLSYGIYMVHIFVQARMINAATLIERFTNVELVAPFSMDGETFYGFGSRGALFGTAMLVIMIALVVTVAFYRPCPRGKTVPAALQAFCCKPFRSAQF